MTTVFPIENVEFYLLVIAGLIAMATYTWQFKNSPGAKQQVYLQLCKAAWLSLLLLVSSSSNLPAKVFWFQLYDIVAEITPFAWFCLIWKISRPMKAIPSVVKYGYPAVMMVIFLCMLTNSQYGLTWQSFRMEGQNLIGIQGPLSRLGNIAWIISLVTLLMSFHWFFTSRGLRRKQAMWFALAGIITLAGVVTDVVFAVKIMPFATLLAAFCVTWCYYRWQNYNIFSLAQQVVIRDMIDGLLVVDDYGYIADLNPAAKSILQGLPVFLGGKFEEVRKAWPVLADIEKETAATLETARKNSGNVRWYKISMTSLSNGGYILGKAVVFKEITQQKADQQKMLEQEKALSIFRERQRLGMELHDGPGQLAAFLKLQYRMILDLLAEGKVSEAAACIEKLMKVTDNFNIDVRESITGLKTSPVSKGLVPTVQEFLQWYEQNYGIATSLVVSPDGIPQFTPSEEMQILRIIQEAMTNARKHAKASLIRVFFDFLCNQAVITITDNGCGFYPDEVLVTKERGHGLTIMRERAGEIGASLKIESVPNEGTKVTVHLSQNQRSAC